MIGLPVSFVDAHDVCLLVLKVVRWRDGESYFWKFGRFVLHLVIIDPGWKSEKEGKIVRKLAYFGNTQFLFLDDESLGKECRRLGKIARIGRRASWYDCFGNFTGLEKGECLLPAR